MNHTTIKQFIIKLHQTKSENDNLNINIFNI
jgi:hypothetical protein